VSTWQFLEQHVAVARVSMHRLEKTIRDRMQLRLHVPVKIQQSVQHIVRHVCGADSQHDKQAQSRSRDLSQGSEHGRDGS
jgi:hypothetical protein